MTIQRDKFSDSDPLGQQMAAEHSALAAVQATLSSTPAATSGGIDLRHYLDETLARVPIFLGYPYTIVDTPLDDVMNDTAAGERMSGNSGNDTFHGLGGDDYLEGGNGNDTLYGDEGNDFIDAGHNRDYDAGGPGDDLYGLYPPEPDGQDTIVEQPGEGFDFIICSADTYTLPANVEGLILHIDGGDGFGREGIGNELDNVIQGTTGPNHIMGMAGNDLLLGMAGDDTIDGGAGNDWIEGGDGDDLIIGSSGADTLLGGAGADTFDFRGIGFAPGFVQQIYGGGTSSVDAGAGDVLKLPGAASDYNLSLQAAQGEMPERTVITHIATGAVIYAQSISRISYGSSPADEGNTVHAVDDVLAGREEDTPVNITQQDLIENDVRQPGAPLTITRVDSGTHGSIVLRANGEMTFTPDRDFFGDATFSYVVTDGVSSSTGHVVIHVKPVNDAPDDILLSDKIIAGGTKGAVIGALSAHDVDSTNFTFSIVDRVSEFRVVTIDGRQMLALAEGVSLSHDQTPEITVKIRVDDDANPVGSYQKYLTLTVNAGLFSDGVDTVDFNHLTAAQIALAKDSNLYDALGGDDVVVLPDMAHYRLPDSVLWDPAHTFHAGAGDDKITGGDGNDFIDGGPDNDTIKASAGSDRLTGGGGNDVFDLETGLAANTTQTIDGGAGEDKIMLPGAATDYTILVSFADAGDPRTFFVSKTGGKTIEAIGVERVTFAGPIANVVGGDMLLEMVRLANDSYGPNPTFSHLAEKLANEDGALAAETAGVGDAAQTRGWHPLTAIELGMAAAGNISGALNYSLVNGHYQAVDHTKIFLGDSAEANALVVTGLVGGKVTLSIAFRGTDEAADFSDYSDFSTQHYAKYAPLIAALNAYIKDPANHIEQVLVEGHSLGGGMVQEFMAAHQSAAFPGLAFKALTIGSPGSDNDVGGAGHINPADPRIVNFAHTNDVVAMIAPGASNSPYVAKQALALWLKDLELEGKIPAGFSEIVANAQGKSRDGSTVFIDSDVSGIYNTDEHDRTLYLKSLGKLIVAANDTNGRFYQDPLAVSLRAGAIYSGPSLQIAIGQPDSLEIHSQPGDDYVYGGVGEQKIYWVQSLLPRNENRFIDGGSDPQGSVDSLVLPGLSRYWDPIKQGDHYDLMFDGKKVGELRGIEKLVFTFWFEKTLDPLGSSSAEAGENLVPVIYLDGRQADVQQASVNDTILHVTAGVDYVSTGTYDLTANGSAIGDYLLLGGGHQVINGAGGGDIINGINAAAGAIFTVVGGAGNDTLISGANDVMTAIFSGRIDDYSVAESIDGSIVISDQRDGAPDGVDKLYDVDRVMFDGGPALTMEDYLAGHATLLLVGTDTAEALSSPKDRAIVAFGFDGDDAIIGGRHDDILDGGNGSDKLYGGGGNDQYIVGQQADLVFENAGEGTDTVTSTANFYLYANIENLTLAAGAGNIFGVGNELDNIITGNEGNNTLLAGAGADVVHAGAGIDIVYGEAGDDQLFGDAGNDFLAGGIGNDTIDGGAGGDSVYGESGNDVLYGGATFEFDILVGGDGNDVLHGDSGNGDYDYLYGNAGDDAFYVDTGDDLTFEQPGEGTDTVYANVAGANNGVYLYANIENLVLLGTTTFGVGNELNNVMTGNASANYLLGGAGDDILNGKAGNDVLFGQGGADTFVFEHGTGGDVIGYFTPGVDKIDLTAIGYTWEQVQNSMHYLFGDTAIDLGGGDLVVLNGVAAWQLHASDFILASGGTSSAQDAEGFQVALDGGGSDAGHPAFAASPTATPVWALDIANDNGLSGVHFVEALPLDGHAIAL